MNVSKSAKRRARKAAAKAVVRCEDLAARQVSRKGRQPAPKKRWHFAVNTPYGSGSMGSADTAPGLLFGKPKSRNARGARTPMDLLGPETGPTNQVRPRVQVVEQDEPIGIIPGSVTFACTPFPIQPGQASVFAWLEGIANKFEFYRFRALQFYYKPIVSGFAADGQKGKIILSADYDSASGELQNYRQAESMDPHVDAMPYEGLILTLDPARLTPREGKYVRVGVVPAGTDVKTYDAGQLYLCTQGCASTDDIGELRVRYVIEFLNPRLPNAVPPAINYTWSQFRSTVVATVAASNTFQAMVFGTTDANGLNVTDLGGGGYQVTAGSWRIRSQLHATASAAPAASAGSFQVLISKNSVSVPNSLASAQWCDGATYNQASTEMVVSCDDGDIISAMMTATFAGGVTVSVSGFILFTLA